MDPGLGLIELVDADGDTFGDQSDFACLCAAADPYLVEKGGDCNDDASTGADINPGADEMCDNVDNDCDGSTDEPGASDCTNYYRDGDEDDYLIAVLRPAQNSDSTVGDNRGGE